MFVEGKSPWRHHSRPDFKTFFHHQHYELHEVVFIRGEGERISLLKKILIIIVYFAHKSFPASRAFTTTNFHRIRQRGEEERKRKAESQKYKYHIRSMFMRC